MRFGDYEKYTLSTMHALLSVFEEDSDNYIGELDDVDITVFFQAVLGATTYLYNQITDDTKSNIEMTHVLNLLAIQRAFEVSKEDDE